MDFDLFFCVEVVDIVSFLSLDVFFALPLLYHSCKCNLNPFLTAAQHLSTIPQLLINLLHCGSEIFFLLFSSPLLILRGIFCCRRLSIFACRESFFLVPHVLLDKGLFQPKISHSGVPIFTQRKPVIKWFCTLSIWVYLFLGMLGPHTSHHTTPIQEYLHHECLEEEATCFNPKFLPSSIYSELAILLSTFLQASCFCTCPNSGSHRIPALCL